MVRLGDGYDLGRPLTFFFDRLIVVNSDSSMRLPHALGSVLALVVLAQPATAGDATLGSPWTGPRYFEPSEAAGPVEPADQQAHSFDVVVYGGTPGGVTAAIQAARMGKRTALLSFDKHVGGMTSAGLTATDIGNSQSIAGIAREFYAGVGGIKDFRASRAEATFRAMLNGAGVRVFPVRRLDAVQRDGTRMESITTLTGETFAATMFIDATYEGDLFAAAGVSYRVGREPLATFDESLAGQWQSVSWKGVYQFCGLPISPYRTPDDPSSGLLAEITTAAAGTPGQGDSRVQAYNFRMALSNADNRIPFPEPPNYDANRYALLARFLNFSPEIRWTLNYTTKPMTDGPVQMRNGDSNNAGSFSTDYVDCSHRWPDGTFEPDSHDELPPPRRGLPMPLDELYKIREAIFQDHVNYQVGLMYFLANDPQVPASLQERVNRFGLDASEFTETGHWPHALYVREGRRMVSDYVMTQADCESKRVADDSVGLGSYHMDSHFCQRVVVEENGVTTVRNEGGFGKSCPKPYPISYRSLVPRREECENLLVPVCLSASHVAYGSIRMEPVFMILGQSAGTAAAMAIEAGVAAQDVPYQALSQRLRADGQVLSWPPEKTPEAKR